MSLMGMLEDSLWKKIIIFALPLALTSFLQQLFVAADIAIAGKFLGSAAIGAIGNTVPIINLSVNLLVGLSVGATVVVSQLLGEGREDKVSQSVHAAMSMALVGGIIVMLLGWLMAAPLLNSMDTPEALLDYGKQYLYIYFCSTPFLMVFNFGAAILRSQGDTKKPLLCLLCSSGTNIVLNFLLGKLWGVAGIAVATALANMLSCLLLLFFLLRYKGLLRLYPSKLHWHWETVRKILRIGMPAAIQGMVFSVSNIIIQGALNSLGKEAVAASAIALNYEMLAFFLLNSFGQACVAYNGYYFGARNFAMCKKVTWTCLGLSMLITCSACYLVLFNYQFFLSPFTADEGLMKLAVQRLWYIIAFEGLQIVMETFAGSMRGWGVSLVPAVICIFGICIVRVIYVYTVFTAHPTFEVLMTVYPLTWVISALGIFTAYLYVRKRVLVA